MNETIEAPHVRNVLLAAARISIIWLLATPSLTAQGIGNPSFWGQWSGPYPLTSFVGGNKEIAHAIVLPPGGGEDSRVLFIARKATCGTGQVEGFDWLPDRPMVARKITLASSPFDGSEDAFCSGHTVLPDGRVLIAGGLNHVGKCESACNPDENAFGHTAIRLLDTTTDPPTWIETSPLAMNRERWYPTVITLGNGDPYIAGHGVNAEPDGPGINPCPPTQGASWTASQAIEPSHRRYHSVQGLLIDGRVFSAGGNVTSEYHTVNIYEPPYCFYVRPEITSAPAEIQYPPNGEPFFVNVTLSGPSSTVKHVALVRSGSITHAWDMNQRYVILDADVISGTSPDLTLQVQPPDNGFVAPPGYYYLTVVEKTQLLGEGKWVPSPGVWIRVDKSS